MHEQSTSDIQRALPTGTSRTLFLEEVDRHRILDCAHYGDCLDEAVRRNWGSWSCAACPLSPRRSHIAERELALLQSNRSDPGPRLHGKIAASAVAAVLGTKRMSAHEVALELGVTHSQAADALVRLGDVEAARKDDEQKWSLTGERRCLRCGRVKPIGTFGRCQTGMLGRDSCCRDCRRQEAAHA